MMGVSGVGKSTLGRALAARLCVPFADGDDYHPAANIDKMARGEPLTDDDRWPWLERLNRLIGEHASGIGLVLACSALKQAYRTVLRAGHPGLVFVHLSGPPSIIAERLARRPGHFMKPEMLRSQLDTLEEPSDAVEVDVRLPTEEQVQRALDGMPASSRTPP